MLYLNRYQLVVEKKDEHNKKSHEESAKIACEGAGAIKTIASLKREKGCFQEYSNSLELPLRRSVHSAIWGGVLFGLTQSVTFFGLALVGNTMPFGRLVLISLSPRCSTMARGWSRTCRTQLNSSSSVRLFAISDAFFTITNIQYHIR